jgi:DNA-binding protein HU-beta
MKTITKERLVKLVAEMAGKKRNEKEVENIINLTISEIINQNRVGNNVTLRGFGTFNVRNMAKKKARDIGRGTFVIIPAHKGVKFKPYYKVDKVVDDIMDYIF